MAASGNELTDIQYEDITMGKYLGGGGFGSVSQATHEHWGDVAVKKFKHINVTEDVRKEAMKMGRVLSCRYLVTVMGIMEDRDSSLCIVMELMEYGDLMNFNRKYMIGWDCWARKVKMIQEIALGMNFLHTQTPPVLHRDLKLENIFVGTGFMVKIGDLGLALGKETVQNMTTVGLGGTFSHIAPEAYADPDYKPDELGDIYTFSITLFELLSGKDAWLQHATPTLVNIWVQNNKRPNIECIPSDTPKEIIEMMEECWNGDPQKRPSFQKIQKRVTDLYKRVFEASIRQVDRTLLNHIDKVSDEVKGTAGADSGVDSFWGSATQTKINASSQRASKHDSGIGSTMVEKWYCVKKFRKNTGEDFKWARDIGVCKTSIVVVDFNANKAYMYHHNGEPRCVINTPGDISEGKLLYPCATAVTSDNNIVLVDQSQYVKMFTADGVYVRSFSTLHSHEVSGNTKVTTAYVAVSNKGHIMVGDYKRNLITIHNGNDGRIIDTIKISIKPFFLAVISNQTILVSDSASKRVVAVDVSSHKEVFSIDTWLLSDGKTGVPGGVTCDNEGSVYIAVIPSDDSPDASHIHVYNEQGVYKTCIASGLCFPLGITWWNNALYITNVKSVLIYSTDEHYGK